jgi:WD40 repeat protein
MNLTTSKSPEFTKHYSTKLTDYVTALAWSSQGEILAASSAGGEIVLWENHQLITLQTATNQAVNCLAFSDDGKYLAIGGQDGKVKIWCENQLITTLENAPVWVDQLAWSYTNNRLAFSLGRYVQIWDADTLEVVVTLNFNDSSILGIDWRKDGKYLAINGYKGVKIWSTQDWNAEPFILSIPSVSITTIWSGDGEYLASGNMDRTLTVLQWENPDPWVMRGFPGKIRQLAWSDLKNSTGAPILAASSVEGIVVWEKSVDESVGWEAQVLTNHVDIIQAISFAPQSLILASAGADGWLCLWDENREVSQIFTDSEAGFSTLSWHPQGQLLAAGGEQGELIILSTSWRN